MAAATKILLIAPPCIDLYAGMRDVAPAYPPIGLMYLAAYLERENIPVEIFDSFGERADFDEIEKRIASAKDVTHIGVTSVTSTIREAGKIGELAKKYGKTTILGGVHVTSLPGPTMERYTGFDFGCMGEGENTLVEFLNGADVAGIKGLIWRNDDGTPVINAPRPLIDDLAGMPLPARHLVNNDAYARISTILPEGKKQFTMLTARGCPNHCTYCASKTLWGTRVRFRPVESIIAELDLLMEMGMEQLYIIDDTFLLKKSRLEPIIDHIRKLDIDWACLARVNNIKKDLLEMLATSRCRTICFGIESGNQQMLDAMKKNITIDQIKQALALTHEFKIKTVCSFIIGYPGETVETINDTIRLAKELNPDYAQFNMLTPYPGTEVYDMACRGEGCSLLKDFDEYTNPKFSDPVISLPNFTSAELKAHCMRANKEVYFSPRFILKKAVASLTNWGDFKRNIKLLLAFLRISK